MVDKWVDFSQKKPEQLTKAIVCNAKGYMFNIIAIYHPKQNVWVMDDPNYRHGVTLDVTHYIEIPSPP